MLYGIVRRGLAVMYSLVIAVAPCLAQPIEELNAELLKAAANGDAEVVRSLILQGANVSVLGADNLTPITIAAKENPNPEVVSLLIHEMKKARPIATNFFGVQSHGIRIAYIVDVSGSMWGERIHILKNELSQSVNALNAESEFTIILYSSNALQLGQAGWRPSIEESKRQAISEIAKITASGTTNPMPALEIVFSMQPQPDAVFFLTDGIFANSERVADEIGRLARSTNNLTPIHCITFIERDAEEIMKTIAHQTGGSYSHVGVDPRTGGYGIADRSSDRLDDRLPARIMQAALFAAAKHNASPSVLKAIVDEGAQVGSVNEEGFTPLMVAAAFNESPQVIRQLLESGAAVNFRDERGRTPLMMAAQSNANHDVTQIFLLSGASVNSRDLDGFSALMYAAKNNSSIQVLQALLDADAEINAGDLSGYTSLMYAIRNKNTNIMDFLIRSGADVNAKSDNGSTALLLAAGYSEKSILVDLLLNAGADANAQSKGGITPIMAAAFANNQDSVFRKLIDNGSDVNAVSDKGGTALIAAAMKNDNPKVLKVLLDAGAEINYRHRQSGATALMAAAMSNANPQVLLLLLENGANAKISDRSKKTALDYAKENEALKGTDAFWKLNDATYN